MSKPYEDLTEEEKLKGLIHTPKRVGPVLTNLLDVIQTYLDDMAFQYLPMVRESIQIANAMGSDIDNIGDLLDLSRLSNEDDEEFRTRIITTARTFETVTRDAILSLFDDLLGKEPYIIEPFTTKVYKSGDEQDYHEGGTFNLLFEIPISYKSERLRVDSGGDTITVSDPTIVSPVFDSLSTNITSTVTTIGVSDASEFPDSGEIVIDDEWIYYGSHNTNSFLSCVRGLYSSEAISHATSATVAEGSIKVFVKDTNQQVFDSQVGTSQVINLKNNPYDWDSYFDVNYRIRGSEENDPAGTVKKEFDTVAELGSALSQLEAIGLDFKAAGVHANISVGIPLRSWFQDSKEVITVEDSYEIEVTDIYFPEFITPVIEPDTIVFYESEWDVSHWDKAVWSRAFWNGSAWQHFGTKEGYYVEISGVT